MCISFRYAAKDKHMLQSLNITYVLNAAHGKFNVNTGASYYRDTKITYHGVEAFDMPSFDLSPFFYSAAKFIKSAMSTPGGEERKHTPWTSHKNKCRIHCTIKLYLTFYDLQDFLHHDINFMGHLSSNSHHAQMAICNNYI